MPSSWVLLRAGRIRIDNVDMGEKMTENTMVLSHFIVISKLFWQFHQNLDGSQNWQELQCGWCRKMKSIKNKKNGSNDEVLVT